MAATFSVDDIPKPKTDQRLYRWLRLGNGLRAVVVQDEEAVFAAACAEVGVGYFDDPEDLPGLAHFVEHAVHLGTGRYPDERGYKQFLASRGGKSNATTGKIETRFHFEVQNEHLKEALDRLSRFFIDPLFLPEALDREVLNVDSEYSKRSNSDAVKLLNLQRSVGPAPLNRFGTGSVTTLRDKPKELGINVPEVLKQWHKQGCLGDNLTLAVISPHSLDDVEQWVLESFSLVPPRTGEWAPSPFETNVTDAKAWGLRYYEVAPLRELRTLDLVWFIPYGVHTENRCKPWRWVGHHVGHEGDGSAASHLKRKGLIQSLVAGIGEEVRRGAGFMLWHCKMQLTEKGLDHVQEIVATVYESIEILRRLPPAACQTTYTELQEIEQIRFDYKSREQPVNYALALALNVRHYEASDLLTGPALLQEYAAAASTPNAVAARLFARVVTDVLLPTAYSAEIVSTHWSLTVVATGMHIQFFGFNETLVRLVPIVMAKLTNLSRHEIEDRFTVMHGRLVQQLKNAQYMDPHLQAAVSTAYLLTEPSHHSNQLLEACDGVTPEDVVQFWEAFSRDMYAEGLAHGNLTTEETLELWTDVEGMLGATGLDAHEKWPVQRIMGLPFGNGDSLSTDAATISLEDAAETSRDVARGRQPHCVKYVPDNVNPDNANSAIHVLMQVGTDEARVLSLVDLFRAIAQKSCFHQLRTVECLGYVVHLEMSLMAHVVAVGVRIQSPKATPRKLHERLDAWLVSFRRQLEDMSNCDLDKYKASLKDRYLDPPKTPAQAAANFWRHIVTRRYEFDRRIQAVAALETATKRDLLSMYDTYIAPNSPSGRRLCTQVWGHDADAQAAGEDASSTAAPSAVQEAPIAVVIRSGEETVHKALWEPFPGGSIVPHATVPSSLCSTLPVTE
ncbi:unnamed protein product [Ostreobium quekettii]|uniref:Uncharacterized protein n=1 Tax=Ostreobium quekettii TaxID=121088 RepID=A0A8S1IR52_9CHLO|nr:unnamed protein product [Ostreobium quekettii]